ncbi:hypothetical protein OJAV_G00014550 [Oryzias javanicus]|uniref:Uncharacterized protein n=1 Tax=Oryzias javanicus TaxID=123683 RepID=A0A437DKC0_ORYJA|nr:hypothetical protein OJAV_G00014550 [Oryzias javanicus]
MDQCEDTQEGAPPIKNTLCGEDVSPSKAQRNQPGPGYEPSCVSFRSDRSKVFPVTSKTSVQENRRVKSMLRETNLDLDLNPAGCPKGVTPQMII